MKASVRGWHSVHKVLKEMKAEGGRVAAMVEGYHCMLAERLDYTESDHLPLIETAGGNQLYYHIVDDMRIATEIIRRVDATRGRGALEFFALDSMRDGEAAAGCSVSFFHHLWLVLLGKKLLMRSSFFTNHRRA